MDIGDETDRCILVIPPFFNEHNLMRRQLVETMRRISEAGYRCVLPDIPGTNESIEPVELQSLARWEEAIAQAMEHFDASHILAVRSGALIAPKSFQGWLYAPQSGAKLLRGMLRARVIASRELGVHETSERLLEIGRSEGLVLSGWQLGADMIRDIEDTHPAEAGYRTIEQSDLGGPGLWMRAEPDEHPEQADRLAGIMLEELGAPQ